MVEVESNGCAAKLFYVSWVIMSDYRVHDWDGVLGVLVGIEDDQLTFYFFLGVGASAACHYEGCLVEKQIHLLGVRLECLLIILSRVEHLYCVKESWLSEVGMLVGHVVCYLKCAVSQQSRQHTGLRIRWSDCDLLSIQDISETNCDFCDFAETKFKKIL